MNKKKNQKQIDVGNNKEYQTHIANSLVRLLNSDAIVPLKLGT